MTTPVPTTRAPLRTLVHRACERLRRQCTIPAAAISSSSSPQHPTARRQSSLVDRETSTAF